jgi:hypothetical protein
VLKQHLPGTKLCNDASKKYEKKKKDYSEEEILQAIKNYASVLEGESFFKYKWTLDQFLQREGALVFFPDRFVKENYFKTEPEKKVSDHQWTFD